VEKIAEGGRQIGPVSCESIGCLATDGRARLDDHERNSEFEKASESSSSFAGVCFVLLQILDEGGSCSDQIPWSLRVPCCMLEANPFVVVLSIVAVELFGRPYRSLRFSCDSRVLL